MTAATRATGASPRRFRRAPGLGVVGGVLLYLGASSFGDTPDTRDTTTQVADYFTTNRTSVLVGCVLFALGLLALLAVAARISSLIDAGGEPGIGRFVQSAATVAATLMLGTIVLIDASLSYVIGEEAPDMAKGLFELTLVATPIVAFILAGFIGAAAFGLFRTGIGRRWFAIVSGAMAVVLVVSGVSFAHSGPFSPDVQQQVMLLVLVVWLMLSGRGTRQRAQA
jgi:hypothetical protein